jgi:hypothetical protein
MEADSPLLRVEDLSHEGKELLEIQSVLLFDLQHSNYHTAYLLPEFLLYPLELLQQRIQTDLEGLIVVDIGEVLPEDNLHQHESKSKYI